ncbi:vacuolar fusion protein ccz1 [Quaeritorhiza haematococci]|nr:vacuolar fusion protein ccz1 [Quaeritorhiza haematococci]
MRAGDQTQRPPSLLYFCVFNPSLGTSEELHNAKEQICYFHPPTTPLDEQVRQVGLTQALVHFTKTFSAATPCENVHSNKHRLVMLEAEPGYWIMLKVKVGTITRVAKDGKKVVEYLGSELPDSALRQVAVRSYEMFKLFHKGFSYIVDKHSLEVLRQKLDEFFTSFLDQLDLTNLDLMDMINGGLHFMSLDRKAFLSVVSFVRELERRFPAVSATLFLWHHYLIWSGLNTLSEARTLYDYLTHPETGKFSDNFVNQVKSKGEAVISTRPLNLRATTPAAALISASVAPPATSSSSSIFSRSSANKEVPKFSGYLVGPVSLGTATGTTGGVEGTELTTVPLTASVVGEPKRVYIGPEAKEHYCIVYQFREQCTITLVIPSSSLSTSSHPSPQRVPSSTTTSSVLSTPTVASPTSSNPSPSISKSITNSNAEEGGERGGGGIEALVRDRSFYLELRNFLEEGLPKVCATLVEAWTRARKVGCV